MIKGKINNPTRGKTHILIAPLDWGLGHATRCIPIIKELIELKCEVILAADGATYSLLKKEFSSITIIPLAGYRMHYSRKKVWLPLHLFIQIPKFIRATIAEHRWLKKIIRDHQPDIIISDNRLGLYNSSIFSIYITHQLVIKTGHYLLDKLASKIHHHFIKKYDLCWVPDFEKNRLAGELSHPHKMLSNTVYIGPLSRFEKLPAVEKKYDIVISISGPEPQRTIFETLIFNQLKCDTQKTLIIRGLPGQVEKIIAPNDFAEVVNHLSARELNSAMQQAGIIICRSGYTTIMDLVKIGKNAILIPTPGQTEQEYLAKYLMEKKLFFSTEQKGLSIEKALYAASAFPFIKPQSDMEGFKKNLYDLVQSYKSARS
ncbi:MAG: glycosyltransferase [Ginsengibacter sp.]